MDELNPDRKATLGCGTLILIALIVIIFSKGGVGDLEAELRKTTTRLESLENGMTEQTAALERLRMALERQTSEVESLRQKLEE